MFMNKQDPLDIATGRAVNAPTRKRFARWGGAMLGAILLCALAGPVRAQQDSSDTTPRTGDRPDPVIKKDGAPPGMKTNPKTTKNTKSASKSNAKSDSKMAAKSGKKGSKNGYEAKRTVLVFPVDATGAAALQLSDVITDVEKSRLSATGTFGPVSFLPSLPSIRRSVTEQSLTPADVAPPFAVTYKAQKLTAAAGYDAALISTLISYEYNADEQNVTMVLSVQMIDYSGSTPVSSTAADTVKTAPKSAKNATDTTAATEAARTLTEKLMTSVLKSAMTPKTAAPAGTAPAGAGGAAGAAAPTVK